MATPPAVNCSNLDGKFSSNNALSDNPDPSLALQGVPWMARKAISFGAITLALRQHSNDAGIPCIDIEISLAVGLKGKPELRILDWSEVSGVQGIFGPVIGQTRYYQEFEMAGSGGDEDRDFLNAKVLQDGTPSSWLEDTDQQHVQSFVRSAENGWTMEQTWGFEEVGGKRYHTRRIVVRKGEQVQRARFVYDYAPL